MPNNLQIVVRFRKLLNLLANDNDVLILVDINMRMPIVVFWGYHVRTTLTIILTLNDPRDAFLESNRLSRYLTDICDANLTRKYEIEKCHIMPPCIYSSCISVVSNRCDAVEFASPLL